MKNLFVIVLMVLAVSLAAQTRDANEVSREVAMLNAMLELENASWRADVTSVSLLSQEEMQKMMGLVEPLTVSREEFVVNEAEWPARGSEYIVPNVTEVKNQASCGSCVAFGTTAAFEQTYWKKTGSKTLFSERYLFFCSPYTGYGCDGGWSLNGGAVAASNSSKGMILDADCKYYDGSYHYDCGASCNKTKKYTMSYSSVSSGSFMSALNSGKAVIIGVIVYDDFRSYKDGVYEYKQGSKLGGHCMTLVGYGTSNANEKYWVIKNSWGTGWGKSGYLRLRIKSEQKNKQCNIEDWGGYAFQ